MLRKIFIVSESREIPTLIGRHRNEMGELAEGS